MISIKNKYLLSTCFLLYSCYIVGNNPKAFAIPIFRWQTPFHKTLFPLLTTIIQFTFIQHSILSLSLNKYIDLNESLVKEEREYVMLNECKLNNSCKSGNKSLVNKFIDLNESLVKEEGECPWNK
jgi:hypothetical protein